MGRGAVQATIDDQRPAADRLDLPPQSKSPTYPGARFVARDEDERARYSVYALDRRAAEAGTIRLHSSAFLNGMGKVALRRDGRPQRLARRRDHADAAGPGGSEIGTAGSGGRNLGDAWRLWNLAPMIPAHPPVQPHLPGSP